MLAWILNLGFAASPRSGAGDTLMIHLDFGPTMTVHFNVRPG